MNILRSIALAVLIAAAAPPLSAQEALEVEKPSYEDLLAQLKRAEPNLDFTMLRMAYADSPDYAPYGGDRRALEEPMAKKDLARVIQVAEEQLKQNYLIVWAHWALWQASQESGDQKRAGFHQYVLRGMLGSIGGSGDGKSAASAFVVISTDETYFLLSVRGVRVKGQALRSEGGHSYDVMTGVDPDTGKDVTLYFNIDRSFNSMRRLFEKADDKPAAKD